MSLASCHPHYKKPIFLLFSLSFKNLWHLSPLSLNIYLLHLCSWTVIPNPRLLCPPPLPPGLILPWEWSVLFCLWGLDPLCFPGVPYNHRWPFIVLLWEKGALLLMSPPFLAPPFNDPVPLMTPSCPISHAPSIQLSTSAHEAPPFPALPTRRFLESQEHCSRHRLLDEASLGL